MVISDLSIRRPVFATVLSLVVVLLGLVSYQRLTVREYPNIDPPVVTVQTNYRGANANIIETQVTQVLEDSLSGIEGIDYITSVGAFPTVCIFRPVIGSDLEHEPLLQDLDAFQFADA